MSTSLRDKITEPRGQCITMDVSYMWMARYGDPEKIEEDIEKINRAMATEFFPDFLKPGAKAHIQKLRKYQQLIAERIFQED